jgi:hypothetical protein
MKNIFHGFQRLYVTIRWKLGNETKHYTHLKLYKTMAACTSLHGCEFWADTTHIYSSLQASEMLTSTNSEGAYKRGPN